jgi:pilus assembly protein Flp/PilA
MLRFFAVTQNFLADGASSVADRLRRDRGATAVEYGLLVALIAGAIIVIVGTLGRTISGWFTNVNTGVGNP